VFRTLVEIVGHGMLLLRKSESVWLGLALPEKYFFSVSLCLRGSLMLRKLTTDREEVSEIGFSGRAAWIVPFFLIFG
jgi:hypothetical protein